MGIQARSMHLKSDPTDAETGQLTSNAEPSKKLRNSEIKKDIIT
jgi:hypothetical protein